MIYLSWCCKMKKNNKMTKTDLLYIILPPLIQSIFYFLVQIIVKNPHVISSPIDSHIPFLPIFVYPYIFWYLMLIIVPFMIYEYDKELLKKYDQLFMICSSFCILIFLIYPTTIERANFAVNGLSSFIVNIIYTADNQALNCFPSIHALDSMLFMMFLSNNKRIPKWFRLFITILSILVILATIFIKQHVIYDIIGSFIILVIGYIIQKLIIKKKR